MGRDYYNRRVGKDGESAILTLREAAEMVAEAYLFIEQQSYLQRSFGYFCVDAAEIPGRDGYELHRSLLLATGIRVDGRVSDAIKSADEVTLFTIVEFVFDHVAKPVSGGSYHSWSGCGWHYGQADKFDEVAARQEWREKVSKALKFYDSGYELSEAGEIVHLAPNGTVQLLRASLPTETAKNDRDKVANAVRVFHLARSSRQERKQAVRELADVLEFHRSRIKELILTRDENDLFRLANNFALRHYSDTQQDDYDDTFLTWLFFVFLATVHLLLAHVAGVPGFGARETATSAPVSESDDIPF